eukprot:CAMPEP_0113327210 /NCGR_PEP_ID=MMETSP0010_2-20120614/19125_1 /TAXON_ID=216773 ORGANISM="Corethron hystrix, Strain 308" /NCGR_SAMPLE_ID=MMETSP0010_2 /ASSEMBLY_ACC=CAM_ASM_000155 /LENGTH=559 /DNA_ID=CAMNT_0000187977 /DNA_START=201 /DNA_END=1880 /DNA_ORIENTATION=+ /assembly_acc=CAM_ASM_000155
MLSSDSNLPSFDGEEQRSFDDDETFYDTDLETDPSEFFEGKNDTRDGESACSELSNDASDGETNADFEESDEAAYDFAVLESFDLESADRDLKEFKSFYQAMESKIKLTNEVKLASEEKGIVEEKGGVFQHEEMSNQAGQDNKESLGESERHDQNNKEFGSWKSAQSKIIADENKINSKSIDDETKIFFQNELIRIQDERDRSLKEKNELQTQYNILTEVYNQTKEERDQFLALKESCEEEKKELLKQFYTLSELFNQLKEGRDQIHDSKKLYEEELVNVKEKLKLSQDECISIREKMNDIIISRDALEKELEKERDNSNTLRNNWDEEIKCFKDTLEKMEDNKFLKLDKEVTKAKFNKFLAPESISPIEYFEDTGLSKELHKSLHRNGLRKPTPILKQALFPFLCGKNLLVQTDTEKGTATASAVLTLAVVDATAVKKHQALIITKTCERAKLIHSVVNKLMGKLKIVCETATYGDGSYRYPLNACIVVSSFLEMDRYGCSKSFSFLILDYLPSGPDEFMSIKEKCAEEVQICIFSTFDSIEYILADDTMKDALIVKV